MPASMILSLRRFTFYILWDCVGRDRYPPPPAPRPPPPPSRVLPLPVPTPLLYRYHWRRGRRDYNFSLINRSCTCGISLGTNLARLLMSVNARGGQRTLSYSPSTETLCLNRTPSRNFSLGSCPMRTWRPCVAGSYQSDQVKARDRFVPRPSWTGVDTVNRLSDGREITMSIGSTYKFDSTAVYFKKIVQ